MTPNLISCTLGVRVTSTFPLKSLDRLSGFESHFLFVVFAISDANSVHASLQKGC
jgi:hypothetical protein